jgi:hypothetical protein
MRHYIVTIEGPNFDDVEEIELPAPPEDRERGRHQVRDVRRHRRRAAT